MGVVGGTIGYNIDLGTTGGEAADGANPNKPVAFTSDKDLKITSQELADAWNALNGLTIEETFAKDGTAATAGTVRVNGQKVPADADAPKAELGKVGNGKLVMDNGMNIYYRDEKGTETKLGQLTATTMTKAANAGTITTTMNVGQATFTPANKESVKLVEPKGKVSQSNSNNAATAPLTYTDHLVMQVGARTKDSVDFTFNYESNGIGDLIANMNCSARADGLGTADLKLTDQKSANAAIDHIDNAINKVSMVRATFGATQNRLEHKIDNMNVTIENLTSAESRIRDTNMAEEMMNFTKQQILSQASQSMLAQANQLPQSVLQLLQ